MTTGTPDRGFEWPVRVYWEDTDAGGIVFYANYLKFFERARTEWLRQLGVQQQHLRETQGGMFVVTDTQVRYHRPARLDDLLLVTARLVDAGRASLTIGQSAHLQTPVASSLPLPHSIESTPPQADGLAVASETPVLCEGTIRIGWVDALSMRPQRIPPAILDALRGH